MKIIDEIGQMLVSGALDWTKKIRKTAADMFAKSAPEKKTKKTKQSRCSPEVSQFFPWIWPKTREFPYKRLGATCWSSEL